MYPLEVNASLASYASMISIPNTAQYEYAAHNVDFHS